MEKFFVYFLENFETVLLSIAIVLAQVFAKPKTVEKLKKVKEKHIQKLKKKGEKQAEKLKKTAEKLEELSKEEN